MKDALNQKAKNTAVPTNILLLKDHPDDAHLVARKLEQEGLHCIWTVVKTQQEFQAALLIGGFDVIISDYSLPGFNGLSALELAKNAAPDCPFIFVSGTLGEESAIESLTRGATDYVLKDRMGRLGSAIRRALRESRERAEKRNLESQYLRAQRLETIGALAGGIAHDLNNALAPILMGIELLHDCLPEERENILKTMQASARHGSEMVRQILSFARGASGKPVVLELKHLVQEMNPLISESFPRSIEIRINIGRGPHAISGNATQIHQVLLNLCVNARDAMPQGGVLQIEVTNHILCKKVTDWQPEPVSGSHVRLRVSDRGHGMNQAVLARIFEPFFSTKPASKGSGLGLSTVKGIVKSHGGFIEVATEEGKGTTFDVYFPATACGGTDSTGSKSRLPVGQGEQVLVIDDEIGVLEMMRETLEAFNYRVLTAKHGGEALVLYQQHRAEIAAVISDLMMPVMDGPTTIRSLRKVDPAIKVISMTGLGSEALHGQMAGLDVQASFAKPFAMQDLLTVLRKVLEKHAEPADHKPETGGPLGSQPS